MRQGTAGICWHRTYKTYPVPAGPGSALWFSPERLWSDNGIQLLHTQVPCGRGLTWTASDWRDWQATEEEVHGGQQGLQKTDRAESGASVGGKVDFIGVRTGWLEDKFILTGRPGGKEMEGVVGTTQTPQCLITIISLTKVFFCLFFVERCP